MRPIPRFSKMMRMSARTLQIVMECSFHLATEVAIFLEQIINEDVIQKVHISLIITNNRLSIYSIR
ncbi:MAG: hypothetical protein ACTSRI_04195 [Promethearchaeota archaeon]